MKLHSLDVLFFNLVMYFLKKINRYFQIKHFNHHYRSFWINDALNQGKNNNTFDTIIQTF